MAKNSGKRVADVMNEALKLYLASKNDTQRYHDGGEETPKITNDGFIRLSKRDITALHKELGDFRIETSGSLIFEKDVDRRALDHIQSIFINGGTVEVPRDLYPFFILKSVIHGKLLKY